ncbi:MAG: methylmalonyl-CoA mutase family protein, partial [Rhizobiaceae bacterium]
MKLPVSGIEPPPEDSPRPEKAATAAVARIDDSDPRRANAQARRSIAGGAGGLSLVFEEATTALGKGLPAREETIATVLDGIALDGLTLRMDAHPGSRLAAGWLVSHLAARKADPARLSLSLGIDPAAVFARTGRLNMSVEALKASMPQSLVHFFAMGVPGVLLEADGRVFHNAGATPAQEIGAALAIASGHLKLFEQARQALVY